MANWADDGTDRLYREFGKRLAQLRKSQKLSQQALGKRLKLTRASIANIEAGRQRILLHHLFHLSNALSLPVSDLVAVPTRTKVLAKASSRPTDELKKLIKHRNPGLPDPVVNWIATVVVSARDSENGGAK